MFLKIDNLLISKKISKARKIINTLLLTWIMITKLKNKQTSAYVKSYDGKTD